MKCDTVCHMHYQQRSTQVRPPDNSKCCARRHLQIPTTYPLARVLCIYNAVACAVGQTFEVVPVTVCIYGGAIGDTYRCMAPYFKTFTRREYS